MLYNVVQLYINVRLLQVVYSHEGWDHILHLSMMDDQPLL